MAFQLREPMIAAIPDVPKGDVDAVSRCFSASSDPPARADCPRDPHTAGQGAPRGAVRGPRCTCAISATRFRTRLHLRQPLHCDYGSRSIVLSPSGPTSLDESGGVRVDKSS